MLVARRRLAVQQLGGTVVVLERFDPEAALAAIERFRVTHSQWVPTMFVRMLGLPEEVRRRHDLSSHRCAIHAAAPCPPAVKRAMIEWWGPVLREYYAGSEGVGTTVIDSCWAPRAMVPECCSTKLPLLPCRVPVTRSMAT